MSTPLSEFYDAFFIKSGQNWLYKEDQVFQFLKTGFAKSRKTLSSTSTYLDYSVDTDNMILTVYGVAEYDGDITITINSNTYTISLLTTDTKSDIINKIKTEIEVDWDVDVSYLTYPRIKITKTGVSTITVTITDTDDTNVFITAIRTYDGSVTNTLNQDEIELIALNMLLESKRQRRSELDYIKQHLGSKDFNRLPDKASEYKILAQSIKDLEDEIFRFRQEFYTYEN